MNTHEATCFTTALVFALIGLVASSATARDPGDAVPAKTVFADRRASTPDAGPVLAAVVIDAPSISIPVNGTVRLVASTLDENGSPFAAEAVWSSSSTAFATVNSTGLVTGVASGPANITVSASAGGVTVSTTIVINVMPRWAGAPSPTNVLVNDASKGRVPDIAQKEPSIALFGARIVVGWNDETVAFGQTLRGVKSGVGYGFSNDGGATFQDGGEVGSSHWGADPSLAIDRSGNVYFGRIDLQPGSATLDRIAVFKSTGAGSTFQGAATASDDTASRSGVNDAPMIAVDTTAGALAGTVYASWTFAASGVLTGRLSRSTDGGVSFSQPIQIATRGMPAVGPDGEVYVLGLNANDVVIIRSTDGGLSFGPSVRVASADPLGELETDTAQYCGRVLRGSLRASVHPRIAVDRSGGPNNGIVYVVFDSHGAGADGSDVFLTRSKDGGATWSTPLRLNDDAAANDQWLPFVTVAPNGAVAVSWYDRRLDDQDLLIDLFMRISTDGGVSFGPNLKITDVSFPPPGINRTLGFPPYTCYFASYNWIAADAANFHLVWTDNRRVKSSMIDSNIFFAKVAVPSGAFPAVEYYNATLDHYFITWLTAEQANLDAGNTPTKWVRTGSSFKTYPTVQAGCSPVCRYYIPPTLGDSHFFGRGTAECDATGEKNPTFVLEDRAFMQTYLPSAGACPANTTPVYRVFDNRADANHRYMTDRAIRDQMVAKGWLAEGDGPDLVVMCAPQ